MKKRMLVIGLALVSLLGAVLSWAATNDTQGLPIASGSSLPGGAVANPTSLSNTFTITQGRAEKISGVELYKIDLGNASFYNRVSIFIYLLNPEDIGKVLNNPNAFINVQVAYKVNDGEDYTLSDATKVKVDTSTSAIITRESGQILLQPTNIGTVDTDTYYILGSITTPGGVPPGQQTQLTELRSFCEVRKY